MHVAEYFLVMTSFSPLQIFRQFICAAVVWSVMQYKFDVIIPTCMKPQLVYAVHATMLYLAHRLIRYCKSGKVSKLLFIRTTCLHLSNIG